MDEVRCVYQAKAIVGECPRWNERDQALYWTDIYRPSLNRFDPATGTNRSWDMPESVGCFAFRAHGGLIAGTRTGFAFVDLESGTERLVVVAETRSANPSEPERIKADIVRLVDEALGLPPDHVELVPPQTVPKTSSGKIRRLESRALYESGQLGGTAKPPWLQVARLWMENAGTWAAHGLRGGAGRTLAFLDSVGKQKLAIAGGLLARLSPSQGIAAGIVRGTAGLLSRAAYVEVQSDHGESGSPVLFVANRAGPHDALYLLGALPRPTVLAGEQGLRPLPWAMAFLLEPLLVPQTDSGPRDAALREDIRRALESGCSVLLLSDAPGDAGPLRSRFRLEPIEAAGDARSPIVPVYIGEGAMQPGTNNGSRRRPHVAVKTGSPRASSNNGLQTNGLQGAVQLRDELRREIAALARQPSNDREPEPT